MCLEAGDRVRAGLALLLPDLPETYLPPILRSQALGHFCSGAMGSVTSHPQPTLPPSSAPVQGTGSPVDLASWTVTW